MIEEVVLSNDEILDFVTFKDFKKLKHDSKLKETFRNIVFIPLYLALAILSTLCGSISDITAVAKVAFDNFKLPHSTSAIFDSV